MARSSQNSTGDKCLLEWSEEKKPLYVGSSHSFAEMFLLKTNSGLERWLSHQERSVAALPETPAVPSTHVRWLTTACNSIQLQKMQPPLLASSATSTRVAYP